MDTKDPRLKMSYKNCSVKNKNMSRVHQEIGVTLHSVFEFVISLSRVYLVYIFFQMNSMLFRLFKMLFSKQRLCRFKVLRHASVWPVSQPTEKKGNWIELLRFALPTHTPGHSSSNVK